MVIEQALLARTGQPPESVAATLRLSDVILTGAGGNRTVDVDALRALRKTFTAHVLWLELPDELAYGGALPPLVGLNQIERQTIDELVHAVAPRAAAGLGFVVEARLIAL